MYHKILHYFVLCFFLMRSIDVSAQSEAEVYLQQARAYEKNNQEFKALQKYEEGLRYSPGNVSIICKLSELYSQLGKLQNGKQQQLEFYKKAKSYASTALKLQPSSAEANFVMSVAQGNQALIAFGSDKIDAVKQVKFFAEKAVQLDPSNFKGYHVLGKWNAEVSGLNNVEKWLVKVTFGGLPAASYDKAIECFEKSRKLNPTFLLNYLELAKCYFEKEDNLHAKEMLQFIAKAPANGTEDLNTKKEAAQLASRL